MNGKTFLKICKGTTVSLFITVGGVAITIFNLYLTSRLLPITNAIGKSDNRVSAIEQRLPQYELATDSVISLQTKVDELCKRTDRIESKVDLLLMR